MNPYRSSPFPRRTSDEDPSDGDCSLALGIVLFVIGAARLATGISGSETWGLEMGIAVAFSIVGAKEISGVSSLAAPPLRHGAARGRRDKAP